MNKKSMSIMSVALISIIGTLLISRVNQSIPHPYLATTIVSEIIGGLCILAVLKKGNEFAQSGIITVIVAYMLVSIGFSHFANVTSLVSNATFMITQIAIHTITVSICMLIMINGTKSLREY